MKNLILIFTTLYALINLSYSLDAQSPTQQMITLSADKNYCDLENAPFEEDAFFEDDFNGSALDEDKWLRHYPKGRPWGNLGDQYFYSRGKAESLTNLFFDENVSVSNGLCRIEARRQSSTWCIPEENLDNTDWGEYVLPYDSTIWCIERDFSAGVIYGKEDESLAKYGKFEMRHKHPSGQGTKSSFWLWSEREPINEIDFFEYGTKDNGFLTTGVLKCYPASPNCLSNKSTRNFDRYMDWVVAGGEWLPHKLEFYYEDVPGERIITHTIYKYYYLDGTPVEDCSIPAGEYLLNLFFPTYPQQIVANLVTGKYGGVYAEPPGPSTVMPETTTWFIDWIKVHKRDEGGDEANLCPDGNNTLKIKENTVLTENFNVQTIEVESGVQLILNSNTIGFSKEGEILLRDGARLILNGATLTKCSEDGENWVGVKGANAESIIMTSGSVIEYADIGIELGKFPNGMPNFQADCPDLIMNNQSIIRNCNLGIHLGEGTTTSTIDNSSFIDNGEGISCVNNAGMKVQNTTFTNNGIVTMDSFLEVLGGCQFQDAGIGILVGSTFENSGALIVGENQAPPVTFNSNLGSWGIGVESQVHPVGVNVYNSAFNNCNALTVHGAAKYEFNYNQVDNDWWGIFSHSSGETDNFINCNQFSTPTSSSIVYMYNNENSQFLQNDFNNFSNSTDVTLLGAHIKEDIGNDNEAASNCFGENSDDFFFLEWSGGEIPNFKYHYTSDTIPELDVNCQEPMASSYFSSIPSLYENGNCPEGRPSFTSIDPDGDGEPGIDYDDPYVVGCCLPDLQDSIDKYIIVCTGLGGDDPRTLENESYNYQPLGGSTSNTQNAVNSQLLNEARTKMRNWIDFGTYAALRNHNLLLAEQILKPLKAWKYQKTLFGTYIKLGELNKAKLILAKMPSDDEEQSTFKQVQTLNIKRLDGISSKNPITPTDLQTLITLADTKNSASGYARSLYRYLTGKTIPFEYPTLTNGRSSTFHTDKSANEVKIYPNPFKNEINISALMDITSYKILDVNGRTLIQKKARSQNVVLETYSFKSGIYIVQLILEDGSLISKLINKG